MCSSCEVTETGICFCGTANDPNPRADDRACGCKSGNHCNYCNHDPGAQPAGFPTDVEEFEY